MQNSDKRKEGQRRKAVEYAQEPRKRRRHRSPKPRASRVPAYLQLQDNIAAITDTSKTDEMRAMAANAVFMSIDKKVMASIQKATQAVTAADSASVRNFVKQVNSEVRYNPVVAHTWFLLFRHRLEQKVQGSLEQNFKQPLSCVPWDEARPYLLRSLAGDDNYYSVTKRLELECTFDNNADRTESVPAFVKNARLARQELLNRFPSGQVSDMLVLELLRKWMGVGTWIAAEFTKLYTLTDEVVWSDVEAALDKLVNRVSMSGAKGVSRERNPTVPSTTGQPKYTAAQTAAYEARKSQWNTMQAQLNQLIASSTQRNPTPQPPPGPPPAVAPSRPWATPFCGFCRHLGLEHKTHTTRACPHIDDPQYAAQKQAWKEAGARTPHPMQQAQFQTPAPQQGRPGLGHTGAPN